MVGNWLISPWGDGGNRAHHPHFLPPTPEFMMGQGDIATGHQGSVIAVGDFSGYRDTLGNLTRRVYADTLPQLGWLECMLTLGYPCCLCPHLHSWPQDTHGCRHPPPPLGRSTHSRSHAHSSPNAIHTVPTQVHHTPPPPGASCLASLSCLSMSVQ